MVATKLSEIAGKGWGMYSDYSLSSEKKDSERSTLSSPVENSSASSTLHRAARSAYSGIAGAYSSLSIPSLTLPGSSSSSSSSSGNVTNDTPEAANNETSNSEGGVLARAKASTSSLQQAAQSAYSGISNAYSSLYIPSLTLERSDHHHHHHHHGLNHALSEDDGYSASGTTISGLSHNGRRRRKSGTLLRLMDNPYIGVRGGGRLHRAKPPHESMDAVRKLLYVVDEAKRNSSGGGGDDRGGAVSGQPQRRLSSHSGHFEQSNNHEDPLAPLSPSRPDFPVSNEPIDGNTATPRHRNSIQRQDHLRGQTTFLPHQLATINSMESHLSPSIEELKGPAAEAEAGGLAIDHESHHEKSTVHDEKTVPSSHSPEETASQLTEGTLRAMRDLALDEALELHSSLKYWSDRWERPFFSWFVAGPLVWFGYIRNTDHLRETTQYTQQASTPETFGGGYDHSVMVGQRVSQIQAVLARRLSAIGELQHHLLRAGWQRGVAHWGFLGDGGNWAAVDGTDGRMNDEEDSSQHSLDEEEEEYEEEDAHDEEHESIPGFDSESQIFAAEPQEFHNANAIHTNSSSSSIPNIQPLDLHQSTSQPPHQQQSNSHRYRLLRREFSEATVEGSIGLHIDVPPPVMSPILSSPTKRATSKRMSQHDERRKQGSLYYANLHVRKRNGGHIQKDDQAMAEWSIDALALIRSQLIRAANGKLSLPCSENWPFEHVTGNSSDAEEPGKGGNQNGMPAWAGMKTVVGNSRSARTRMESRGSCFSITEEGGGAMDGDFPKIRADCFEQPPSSSLGDTETPQSKRQQQQQQQLPKRRSPSQNTISSVKQERAVVGISNLPLMMTEVSSLLDVMEDIMDIQRARRLEKLKPPPWWRQHWFLVVLGPPSLAYLLYNNLTGKGQTWQLVKSGAVKMGAFAREHVVLPCVALYDEFTKGPESISDHAARDTATETLKKMIRAWLDET
jgi:hypothetical protein